MGVTTNGILFYGYCWADETNLFGDSEEPWTEIVLQKRGEHNPWDDFPPAINATPYPEGDSLARQWSEANAAALDAWRDRKRAVEAEFDVIVAYHCSGECRMPYLAVVEYEACRGHPRDVTGIPQEPRPGWNEKLDRFLAEFGIARPQPAPRWWLVSLWS